MRVIAGDLKRRRLEAPKGEHTRPTTDVVKESVFNIIQNDIFTANALDMFCGSGQMGIEALSRGAAHCLFIDNDQQAARLTAKNVALCKLEQKSQVVCADAYAYLRSKAQAFDLVFVDPPYQQGIERALAHIYRFDILKPRGIIVCEAARDAGFPEPEAPYFTRGVHRYGNTSVVVIGRAP